MGPKAPEIPRLRGPQGAINVFNAHLAQGFVPVVTGSIIEDIPLVGPTAFPPNANLCAIHALVTSYNAAREILHQGPVPFRPITVLGVARILFGGHAVGTRNHRRNAMYRDIAGRNAQESQNSIGNALGPAMAVYDRRTFLDVNQIIVLLDVLNRTHGGNFRLGIQNENGGLNINGDGLGPVLWIAHRGSAIAGHYIGFGNVRTPSNRFDGTEIRNLNRFSNARVADAQALVDDGLYRVTETIGPMIVARPDIISRDLHSAYPGHYIFRTGRSPGPWVTGIIGEDFEEPVGYRRLPLSHLEQITAVHPRPWANPPFLGGDGGGGGSLPQISPPLKSPTKATPKTPIKATAKPLPKITIKPLPKITIKPLPKINIKPLPKINIKAPIKATAKPPIKTSPKTPPGPHQKTPPISPPGPHQKTPPIPPPGPHQKTPPISPAISNASTVEEERENYRDWNQRRMQRLIREIRRRILESTGVTLASAGRQSLPNLRAWLIKQDKEMRGRRRNNRVYRRTRATMPVPLRVRNGGSPPPPLPSGTWSREVREGRLSDADGVIS